MGPNKLKEDFGLRAKHSVIMTSPFASKKDGSVSRRPSPLTYVTPFLLLLLLAVFLLLAPQAATAWQSRPVSSPKISSPERRTILQKSFLAVTGALVATPSLPSASCAADLSFQTSASTGLQWADAKVGSGSAKKAGEAVAIDYVLSTTGARYGTKIYSTQDTSTPYRWTLGDGTTIKGLELVIMGNSQDIPPMLPGGIRRVVIPSDLAYESLAKPIPGMQYQDCQEGRGVGPIPPVPQAFEEYQRFKNIYCNANRPYQPDLVMDIKLYGKRT